jgi:hypothetical protein
VLREQGETYNEVSAGESEPVRKKTASFGAKTLPHRLPSSIRANRLSYGDYVEQLTFLPFLKMVDEQSRTSFNKPSRILKLALNPDVRQAAKIVL